MRKLFPQSPRGGTGHASQSIIVAKIQNLILNNRDFAKE